MVLLTVGYVAGFIAAAIFVAGIWAPSVLAFILSGILREKNTAATWTVASRTLEQTHWPTVLRTDSVKNHGVRKDVLILSRLASSMAILIAIAGVVTPLGLYEALQPAVAIQTRFEYLQDTSPFGSGTPPRSNFSLNRICGGGDPEYMPCPFTDSVVTEIIAPNGNQYYDAPYGVDISIPKTILDIYSSGVDNNSTISNYFDIQWRRYATTSDSHEIWNNGSSYLVNNFRPMDSKVLDSAIEPVEGLIVNTVQGGIGFRNHTFPPGFQFGATWEEDILFIEPETVCVDTNTTIDYTIALINGNGSTPITDLVLTDRGGFVNIAHHFPTVDLSNPQANPDLYSRAYRAAWMTNIYTMLFYNITNPQNLTSGQEPFAYLNTDLGKTFPLNNNGFQSFYDALAMDDTFQTHLNFEEGNNPTNIFDLSGFNFTFVGLDCAGAGSADYANITNIYVKCGLMRGVPQRQDSGSGMIFDPGSRWRQPLYACASAVKATIKTVSFIYNGTEGIQSLKITGVEPKNYSSDSAMPLWGYENTRNTYNLSQLSMIWGLISSEYSSSPNVSSVRQESLYLTGYYSQVALAIGSPGSIDNLENLPASDFYSGSMENAYTVCSPESNTPALCNSNGNLNGYLDYSGDTNMAMWARWQALSNSTVTAPLIPNLIFTDYAAAAVVGTKGVLGPGNTASYNLVPILVTPTHSVIRYRWAFAIPAFITAFCLLVFTVVAVVTILCHSHSLSNMRAHLNQLSPGRIFTTFLYPEAGPPTVSAKEWSKNMGKKIIDLSRDEPVGSQVNRALEKRPVVTRSHSIPGDHSSEGVGFLEGNSHAREEAGSCIGEQATP